MTAVLGGFHLLAASRERMAETVEALRRREIRYLVPAHCTGWLATMRLWQDFPGRCLLGGVGGRIVFGR
jgi:7,8-dihydropterin-6-yl-methyl-4-(beta-D-ribofuranosyl)aminobenzene 5'-phosphate synthase